MPNFLSAYFQYNLHGILSALSGALCLMLGGLVFLNERTSKVNQAFFLFTISASIWIVVYGLSSLVRQGDHFLRYVPFGYLFGIPFIPVNTYLFSLRLLRNKQKIIVLGYVWAAFMMIWAIFRHNHYTYIHQFSWGRYPTWNQTTESLINRLLLIVPFYFFSLSGFFHLYKGYRRAQSSIEKVQIKNILVAFLFAYTGSIDFLPANGVNIYAFGYISLTLFTCIVAYNVIRYQFFNIKIVLKRASLMLGIYAVLMMIIFPLAVPILNRFFQNPVANPTYVVLSLGILIGAVFSFGPFIYASLIRRSFWLKGHLTQGLTHELKSPLSAIQSSMDILIDELKNPKLNREKSLDYAAMVQANATRLETFVKDLLNVAKIQEESFDIEVENDLVQIINDVVTDFKPLAKNKGIEISIQAENIPLLHLDRSKMEQVISNLLSNAVKFSDKGTITIALKKTEHEIICSVQDEGRGIDPKHVGKIFDRFYQASPNTKGSGIGLAIAKAWVEAHGGKIWAESPPSPSAMGSEGGTKMSFMIPI